MRINGEDAYIKYGAKQWNVEMAYSTLQNDSFWEPGLVMPTFFSTQRGMKKIKVSVIFKANSRNDMWRMGAKMIADLLEPIELRLDGFEEYCFKVVLTNATQVENSIKRFHKATLEFEGYQCKDSIGQTVNYTTIDENGIFELTNWGDLETPLRFDVFVGYMAHYQDIEIYEVTEDESGEMITTNFISFHFSASGARIIFDASDGTHKTFDFDDAPGAAGTEAIVHKMPILKKGTMKFKVTGLGTDEKNYINISHVRMYI